MARRKSARINGKAVGHKANRPRSREAPSDSSTVESGSLKSGKVGRKSKLQVADTQEILGDLAILGDEPAPQDNYADWRGSTPVPVQKNRAAPRSGDQFRIGPDFQPTQINRAIMVTSSGTEIVPKIHARIDRGFDLLAGSWVGYKRNYFSLVCSFQFESQDMTLWDEKFHICDDHGRMLNIKCFALRLVPRCYEEDISVILVQHTAKRDKGPQFQPPVYPAVCGILPSHEVIKQSSNIRNREKIKAFDSFCFLDQGIVENAPSTSILKTYPEGRVAKVARYERIQFSTSNLYKKPSVVHKHFLLKVELLAVLDDRSYTVVAYSESPPLIVRGRSPANYEPGIPADVLVQPAPPRPEASWRAAEPHRRRAQKSNITQVMQKMVFQEEDPAPFALYRDIPTSSSDNILDPDVLEGSSLPEELESNYEELGSKYDMALVLADRENKYDLESSLYDDKINQIAGDQENFDYRKSHSESRPNYQSFAYDSGVLRLSESPCKFRDGHRSSHRRHHRHHHRKHKHRHRHKRSSSEFEKFREELGRIESEVL